MENTDKAMDLQIENCLRQLEIVQLRKDIIDNIKKNRLIKKNEKY